MRTCSEQGCGKTLGPNNRSGLCRPHNTRRMNADPEFQARRIAAARAGSAATKGAPHRHRASKAAAAKRLAKPGAIEALREHLNRVRHLSQTPEKIEQRRPKISLGVSDAKLPWCPREYRPLYRELRAKGVDVETARAAVEDTIARDKAKATAERNTFEAKLARVRSGEAGLTAALPNFHLTPTVRVAA